MHTSFKALTAGVLAELGVQAINLDAADAYLQEFDSYSSPIDYSAGYGDPYATPAYDPYTPTDPYYGNDLSYVPFDSYHNEWVPDYDFGHSHDHHEDYYNDFDPYVSGFYGGGGHHDGHYAYDPYNDYSYGYEDYAPVDFHSYGHQDPYHDDYHYEFPRFATGGYYEPISESEVSYDIEDFYFVDPIPKNFNYDVYKRFNTYPHKSEDTDGDTVPIYSDSSHGHLPSDSHQSYTTSDADGHHTDSDESQEFAVSSQEPHLDEQGFSDASDDSYNGYGPYADADDNTQRVNDRVANFEFDSVSDSDDDDGFTDSHYRFSNSTSDRGEISDPLTDSHLPSSIHSDPRNRIEEYKANFPLFQKPAHDGTPKQE